MGSVFLPDHYEPEQVAPADIKLASIAWGFTLGFGFLTTIKAATQTLRVWRRTGRVTTYVTMIWAEMIVSQVFGFICWFYLDGAFPPRYVYAHQRANECPLIDFSFAFFFSICTTSFNPSHKP
jgi:hypothetical protein